MTAVDAGSCAATVTNQRILVATEVGVADKDGEKVAIHTFGGSDSTPGRFKSFLGVILLEKRLKSRLSC